MRTLFLVGILAIVGCAPEVSSGIPVAGSPDGTVEMLTVSGTTVSHTESEFLAAVDRKDDKLILVDFWASWCGPCKMLAPELEKVKAELGDKVEIVKVDVDANRGISDYFQVGAIPDVRIVRNGKTISGFVGYNTSDKITRHLKSLE